MASTLALCLVVTAAKLDSVVANISKCLSLHISSNAFAQMFVKQSSISLGDSNSSNWLNWSMWAK